MPGFWISLSVVIEMNRSRRLFVTNQDRANSARKMLAEDRVRAGTRLLTVPNLAAVLPLLAANLASPFTGLLDTH